MSSQNNHFFSVKKISAIAVFAGIVLIAVGAVSAELHKLYEIPKPSFNEEGKVWRGSYVSAGGSFREDLVRFHMQNASTNAYPEFCLGYALVHTFLDSVDRDKCYFRTGSTEKFVSFKVTDCVHDFDWKDMNSKKPVECNSQLKIQSIAHFKAGKASRYYGVKPLLKVESQVQQINSVTGLISSGGIFFGSLLFACGGLGMLTLKKKNNVGK